MLIDVDNLKQINDALGHAVGDIVLQEVGDAVATCSRSTDIVARIGGDEFFALLPKTQRAQAIRIADRIRFAIAEVVLSSNTHPVSVTASLGIVQVSKEAAALDEVLWDMGPILRQSKRTGKNRSSSQPVGRDNDRGFTLSQVASQLQREGALRAVMQPIVRLADQQTVGYELLTRSCVPGYELPDDFFRACVEANALTLIDHRCFRVCVASAGRFGGTLQFFVNLFPSTLIDIPVKRLADALPTAGARRRCCIEISEQQIVGDPSHLVAPVRALREAGFRIALDDVGVARSTLGGLLLLEPEVVKIDRKCIAGVAQDLTKLRTLKRLLDVAHALGSDVVAEGIESAEDLRVVRKLGVDYGQGFLFGRPHDAAHYESSSSDAAVGVISAQRR